MIGYETNKMLPSNCFAGAIQAMDPSDFINITNDLMNLIEDSCDDLLFGDTPLFDDLFEMDDSSQGSNPWHVSPLKTEKPHDLTSALIQDCMWAPFSQFRSATAFSPVKIEPESELDVPIMVPPDLTLGLMSESDSDMEFTINCAPYTIDNDHCYTKFDDREIKEEEEVPPVEVKLASHYFIETTESDTSDDEIDVETFQPRPVIAIRLQRNPVRSKRKTKGTLGPRETAAVKQKLAKAQKLQQSGKSLAKSNRRRRPANSLNSSSGNSYSNSDAEEPVKRNIHNSMERQRRQAQRSALHQLREQIPELQGDGRAAKVKIIQHGTKCIKEVNARHEGLLEEKRELLEKNMALRMKLDMCKNRFRRFAS